MQTTRDLIFSENDVDTFRWGQFHSDCPIVRRRMAILWFRSLDMSIVKIAELADCAENTVRSALDLFAEGGIQAVERVEVPIKQSALEPSARCSRRNSPNVPRAR